MTIRREMGFCYNCDEKFVPRYRRKQHHLFLLDTENFVEEVGINLIDIENEVIDEVQTLSVHALSGMTGP